MLYFADFFLGCLKAFLVWGSPTCLYFLLLHFYYYFNLLLLVLYHRSYCQEQCYEVSSYVFFMSFTVWSLTFKSLIHFQFIFVCYVIKGDILLFCNVILQGPWSLSHIRDGRIPGRCIRGASQERWERCCKQAGSCISRMQRLGIQKALIRQSNRPGVESKQIRKRT